MTDTANFDVNEKVNILFKTAMGFPSTKETLPWFQETSIEFNNYIFGENILLDPIPTDPCFNINIDPSQVYLSNSNFATSSNDWGIKEDSTGTIHKYSKLILDAVPNSGNNSYLKLDNSNNNILNDSLQFNTKWSGSGPKIYPYVLSNQSYISSSPNAPDEINQDSTGGNWFFDIKNGVIFFPDYDSSIVDNTSNKPVFSFYKYVGRKGISNLNISSSVSSDLSGLINDICLNSQDISNLSFLFDNSLSLINQEINNLNTLLDNCFNSLILDISNLNLKLDNSFISLTDDISNLNFKLDNSFISLTDDISNLNFKLDNSFINLTDDISALNLKLDNSFISLTDDISTLNLKLDNSFISLTDDISALNLKLDNSFISLTDDISALNLKLDNSFISLTEDISALNLKLDNSFISLTDDISGLSLKLDNSFISLTDDISGLSLKLDNSFTLIETSFNYLSSVVQTICGSNFAQQIVDLSDNLNILTSDVSLINSDVNIIEVSLNNIKNTISLLDNTYLTDLSFNDKISIIDSSFSNIELSLNNLYNLDISNRLNKIDFSLQNIDSSLQNIDLSLQNIYSIDISNRLNNIDNSFNNGNLLGLLNNNNITTIYDVTVNNGKYYIDNVLTPTLNFEINKTYRFLQNNSSNSNHQLLFYLNANKSGGSYNSNVIVNNSNAGNSGAYIEITVTSNTPKTLYYQCVNHSNMGSNIQIISSVDISGLLKVNNKEVAIKENLDNSFTSLIDDISALNLKLDNSFTLLTEDISSLNFKLDNSFTSLIDDISDLNLKLDNSFIVLTNDISSLNFKLDNSFTLLTEDISSLNLKLDNCFTLLTDDISSLNLKLDNSFTLLTQDISSLNLKLDNSFTSLIDDISGLNFKLDNSFIVLTDDISSLNLKLDDSFTLLTQDISSLNLKLDNSFTLLTEDISNLNLKLDTSFTSLTEDISSLNLKVDNSFIILSDDISSLNLRFDTSFSLLETSFNYLSSVVETISGSNFAEKIVDLSDNLNILISDVNFIESSLNNIKNTINLLDNTYLTDQSFNDKINIIDSSFNNLVSTISNINNIINTFDSSFVSEVSFNLLLDQVNNIDLSLSESGNISSSDLSNLFVNDVSQTFFEIMTQQPHTFDSSGIADSITSSHIILSWNYDNIIAKHNNLNIAQLSYLQDKTKILPFIDNIRIDISGKVNNIETDWINYNIINISNEIVNYDISFYKILTIEKVTSEPLIGTNDYSLNNILFRTDNFDLRIYGNNFSNNYPTIENRSLYFNNLAFIPAQPPSTPIFVQETIDTINNIKLKYYVEFTELNLSNSSAKLNFYNIDFSENETLSSTIYPIINTDLSENSILNNIDSSVNFDISINNLRSGTKYNYKIQVKNNLNDNSFSEFSNPRVSDFTFLPNSNNINTTINNNITGNSENISNPNFNNSNIIYINLSDSTKNINYSNTSIQSIEISNPNASTSGSELKGYGKFIDNSDNLVVINVSVNNKIKQTLSYDGSFSKTSGDSSGNLNFISLPTNSLRDIYYSGTNNNKGFRLEGRFSLNNISNNNISNYIGDASTNPYVLKYEYLRNSDIGGSNQNNSYNIYIDDLSSTPNLQNYLNSNTINNVIYNMGIPSVQELTLDFSRNYQNINSQYMYLNGNNIISTINSINNISAPNSQNISILNTDIVSSGIYIFNINEMKTKVQNNYNNLNYTTSILTNNFSLTWNETLYNLFTNNNINFTHITNHYCDYNSFSKSNNKIISSIIDLSNINLYEIDNISALENNIEGINLIQYTNHNNQIKDYTLMYINGKFQSNVSQSYPNIIDFSYNGVTISNDFSGGNISYDLSGINTGLNNNGYKFIVFKINKNPGDATANGSYIFNGTIYNVLTNGDGTKYLSLTSLLNGLFETNVISNLFNASNSDNIAFIRATTSTGNFIRIGNLKKTFNGVGGIWTENGGTNVGYNGSLAKQYGAKVENNSDQGIYINFTGINDDLELFIGLKNS